MIRWLAGACLVWLMAAALPALACPFCTATQATFSEELANYSSAVIAIELPRGPEAAKSKIDPFKTGAATRFKIVEVLKPHARVKAGEELEVLYFGREKAGAKFYVPALDDAGAPDWCTPIPVSEAVAAYLRKLPTLPAEGPERLTFFHDYLESTEPMLARDSSDEFAKAPYEAVQALKPRMKHDQLVRWVDDDQIPVSRRRLYLTMLGVCGDARDVPLLERMLASRERRDEFLDALLGAYLVLRGSAGLDYVDRHFLANPKADPGEVWQAVQAIRVVGQLTQAVPRPRLAQSMRLVLTRRDVNDSVIADLARWQDWDATESLVQLFRERSDDLSLRVAVVRFLKASPKPEARERLGELKRIDPAAVERASILAFPCAVRPANNAAPAPSTKR